MSDPSLSDQATNPDQSVVVAQQAQPLTPTNVSGNALLDAQAAAGESQPEGEPITHPIASNFTRANSNRTGDAKTGEINSDVISDATSKENHE